MNLYKITPGLIGILLQIVTVESEKACGVLDNKNSIFSSTVNIYEHGRDGEYKFICSGTVVSSKIIISAARCFYDDVVQSVKNKTFALTVGQKSKTWNRNLETKEIAPNNIVIAKQYKGMQNKYTYNIAIIKLPPNQELSAHIKTPCLYWDNDFVESDLQIKSTPLKIVSWTRTADDFTVLEPQYTDFDVCSSLVSKTFQPFLTFDKMCGQMEGSHEISNLGGGLLAYNEAQKRWYLIGVACETTISDSKTFMTFMKIQVHLNWISNNAFLDV